MMTAIRKRAGDFAAIIVLFIIAVVVGGYILAHQRVRFPFIQEKPFELKAAFSTAQAVTPARDRPSAWRACVSATSPRSSSTTGGPS